MPKPRLKKRTKLGVTRMRDEKVEVVVIDGPLKRCKSDIVYLRRVLAAKRLPKLRWPIDRGTLLYLSAHIVNDSLDRRCVSTIRGTGMRILTVLNSIAALGQLGFGPTLRKKPPGQ
jgi:hypothetical protein